jgi:hypothetical protein
LGHPLHASRAQETPEREAAAWACPHTLGVQTLCQPGEVARRRGVVVACLAGPCFLPGRHPPVTVLGRLVNPGAKRDSVCAGIAVC